MKNLILVLLAVFAFKSYGQENKACLISKSEPPKFTAADSIKVDKISKTITLYGSADLEMDKLKIKADKVYLDQKNNTITASGLKEFAFIGGIVNVAKSSSSYSVLKYNIGSNNVFIE